MIICITGGPKSGKSHLGVKLALVSGARLIRTDDYMSLGWSEASQAVADEIHAAKGDIIAEGVAVPRALRKLRDQHPRFRPCDRLIVLYGRRPEAEPEIAGQARMAKGLDTVLDEILPWLRAQGVEIEERRV